jgi:hypothetical protein
MRNKKFYEYLGVSYCLCCYQKTATSQFVRSTITTCTCSRTIGTSKLHKCQMSEGKLDSSTRYFVKVLVRTRYMNTDLQSLYSLERTLKVESKSHQTCERHNKKCRLYSYQYRRESIMLPCINFSEHMPWVSFSYSSESYRTRTVVLCICTCTSLQEGYYR